MVSQLTLRAWTLQSMGEVAAFRNLGNFREGKTTTSLLPPPPAIYNSAFAALPIKLRSVARRAAGGCFAVPPPFAALGPPFLFRTRRMAGLYLNYVCYMFEILDPLVISIRSRSQRRGNGRTRRRGGGSNGGGGERARRGIMRLVITRALRVVHLVCGAWISPRPQKHE